MKKFKIRPSFIVLFLLFLCVQKFVFLLNYLLALALHELAHIYVAEKKGYKLQKMELTMFGFSISIESVLEDDDKFLINLAGPLCNMLVCVLCFAVYYLVPQSVEILSNFCLANCVLGLFNLIPVQPLDGGKILKGCIKNKKTYKIVDLSIRIVMSLSFFALFISSIFNNINFSFLLVAVFFAIPNKEKEYSFSLFKRGDKKFSKVKFEFVDSETTLFETLKHIRTSSFTIFVFCGKKVNYIGENQILDYAMSFPLETELKLIFE